MAPWCQVQYGDDVARWLSRQVRHFACSSMASGAGKANRPDQSLKKSLSLSSLEHTGHMYYTATPTHLDCYPDYGQRYVMCCAAEKVQGCQPTFSCSKRYVVVQHSAHMEPAASQAVVQCQAQTINNAPYLFAATLHRVQLNVSKTAAQKRMQEIENPSSPGVVQQSRIDHGRSAYHEH